MNLTSQVAGNPDIGVSHMMNALDEHKGTQYTRAELVEFCEKLLQWTDYFDLVTSGIFSQSMKETNWLRFTGDVPFDHHNFGGIAATGGVPGAKNPNIEHGVIQLCVHHLPYLYGTTNQWPNADWVKYVTYDPRYEDVISAGYGGKVKTWGDYTNGRWAYSKQYPIGSLLNGYAQGVVDIATYVQGMGGITMRQATNEMIAQVRNKGGIVIDLRDSAELDWRPNGKYGSIGLSNVKYIIHHWTGDTFERETIKNLTGTDYPTGGFISESMTEEDEIDLIQFYHRYHRDSHGWPGIAYGWLIFPSGRSYIIQDVGTMTYHAFNANSVSYAVCCPNSRNQPSTYPQMVVTNLIWEALTQSEHIPATHRELFGHKEATFLDSRNQTACPGVFMPHVTLYRATGQYSVNIGNRSLWFEETQAAIGGGFLTYWEQNGGLKIFGMPITNEFKDPQTQRTVQYFERARFEHHPENVPEWHVLQGRVGVVAFQLEELRKHSDNMTAEELRAEITRISAII